MDKNKVEICYTSATELAQQLRAKTLSPVELLEIMLERIAEINPKLNAYVTLTPELAMEQAKAAEALIMSGNIPDTAKLLGLPVSVKDLVYTKGVRTTRGSLLYADYVPNEDAPSVERIKAAGGVILGKTNTPEFGWTGSTNNRVFGPTRNPWNLERTPGGSSGGASAAVAAGMGPLAIGTDGGGSIRIPSSYAGIFGIKPSVGRVPVYPASALGDLSHVGPMTRTVADAALFLSVLAGPDERDRNSLPAEKFDYLAAVEQGRRDGLQGLRIAWSRDFGYIPVEPEVAAATEKAAQRFSELGAEVEEANPGFVSPARAFNNLFYGGLIASLADIMPEKGDLLDPNLRAIVEHGMKLSGVEYGQALLQRQALWDEVRRFFDKYDLLLSPTMPQVAFDLNLTNPTTIAGKSTEGLGWTPFTFPFNMTGQPAATVPCGFSSDGLPIGLQIVGKRWDDKGVLRAAAAFEALQDWAKYRPEI